MSLNALRIVSLSVMLGQRERGRGTGRYAVGYQGITEFVSDCSGQSSNLYGKSLRYWNG